MTFWNSGSSLLVWFLIINKQSGRRGSITLVFLEIDGAGLMGGSSAPLLLCSAVIVCEDCCSLLWRTFPTDAPSGAGGDQSSSLRSMSQSSFPPTDGLHRAPLGQGMWFLTLFLKLSYSVHLRRPGLFLPDVFGRNTSVFIRALFEALMLTRKTLPVDRPDHNHLLLVEATRKKKKRVTAAGISKRKPVVEMALVSSSGSPSCFLKFPRHFLPPENVQ